MSTKHACGPNCGDEPTPSAVDAPTNPVPDSEVRADAPTPPAALEPMSHLTDDDCERILFHRGHADYLAAVERIVARHRAEAIAQHARTHGCDETPALRERLVNEDLLVQRIAVGWKCDHEFAGATCDQCFRNIGHAADIAARTLRGEA
jgi:hypothetical protein